tara:strand:+ start:308 stop:484 length:177 start_codon:yes stop_codon:yes gene_type:complete
MAKATPYDPKALGADGAFVVAYPTNKQTDRIVTGQYSGTTDAEISPSGTAVQAGGASW